jgi:hypothetical protein
LFKNIPGSFAEAVLCSISEPAIIYNSDIRVAWANPSAEMFFGHSVELMMGERCTNLFSGTMECYNLCPVKKALETGKEEVLAVNGAVYPHKLIEAIPYEGEFERFILAIIHSTPSADRHQALRTDFGARLNTSATLKEAAPDIVNAMESLTYVPFNGVYIKSGTRFDLVYGKGVPGFLSNVTLKFTRNSPLYLSEEGLAFTSSGSFPRGAAIIPLSSFKTDIDVLLFSSSGQMGTESRSMLEMIADVLQSCIKRLTSRASEQQ